MKRVSVIVLDVLFGFAALVLDLYAMGKCIDHHSGDAGNAWIDSLYGAIFLLSFIGTLGLPVIVVVAVELIFYGKYYKNIN